MRKPASSKTVQIRLFGAAAVIAPPAPAVALERRAAALLALAALEPGISRSRAAAMLWPDSSDPRRNLRQQLLRFKQQLGLTLLDGGESLALTDELGVEPAADRVLLAGHAYDDCEEFADWLEGQRASRRSARVAALRQHIAKAEAEGDLDGALHAAEHLAHAEPGSEDVQRELMRIHYLRGDAAAGLTVHRRLTHRLVADHGAAPSLATEHLARALRDAAPVVRAAASRRIAPTLLRPPRLIGRQPQLRQASEARANGQAVLLLGEAGLGKSRLLAELMRDAGENDAVVVAARPGDAAVPYATLARLLRRLLDGRAMPRLPATGTGALSRLLPELRQHGAAVALPAEGARLLLQDAVQSLLVEAGVRQVAVDDLHFADGASLELLQSLVGSEAIEQVGWLLAQRPAEGVAAAQAMQDGLIESGRLCCIALLPLVPAEVAELLRSLDLPGLTADDWATRLHRHTGGNPLFLLETLKQMQATDVATARLPASATVGALIERRLKALSADALALARLAAVAGPDFGPALAEAVTGRPALELADAWAELESAQVLRERAFAHDLVLEATLRGIPQPIAEHLHAAVARHLQASGGEPARLAAHWLAAKDDAAALPCLVLAADHARDAMRRREEAEFIERAADIVAQRPDLAAPAAVDLYQRAYLARECVDGVGPSLPLLDRALASARHAVDRTRVLAMRAAGRTKMFELEESVADFRAALHNAIEAGDERVISDIASDLSATLSLQGAHTEALDLLALHWPMIERQADPPSSWFSQHAMVLDNAGRPHAARPLHERAMAISRQRREHSETIVCGLNMAISDIDVGALQSASGLLEDCERLRLTHESMDGINVAPWGLQSLVWRDLGQYRQALACSERLVDAGRAQRPARLPMDRLQRAWLWFWLGQWARALKHVLPDADYAESPPWVLARALQLRHRIARAGQTPVGDALARAEASLNGHMLRTMHDSVALDAALAFARRDRAEGLRRAAEVDGFHGVRWQAEWVCAQLALNCGDTAKARAHATACQARPGEHTPLDLAAGTWWQGLWRVWLELGDADRADAARAEGVAWIHRTIRQELAPEFHASFRDAVPAHRALLSGHAGVG